MAEATSAAPLWTIRKTTSRKPRNAATISDTEMTWAPCPGAASRQRLRRTTIAARNRLSAIVAEVECRASPVRICEPPMPEAPILILLASLRGLAAGGEHRARAGWRPDRSRAQPYPARGARRRVAPAIARSFSLEASGGNAPGIAAGRRLAEPRRDALLRSRGAADHCACRHPRGNRLARAAGLDADRAGRLGDDPEPDRHASGRRSASERSNALDRDGGAQELGRGRGAGSLRALGRRRRILADDRSDDRRDARGMSAPPNGGSSSRWSRTPTGSWPATSSGRFRCRSRAAWREPRSRPIR